MSQNEAQSNRNERFRGRPNRDIKHTESEKQRRAVGDVCRPEAENSPRPPSFPRKSGTVLSGAAFGANNESKIKPSVNNGMRSGCRIGRAGDERLHLALRLMTLLTRQLFLANPVYLAGG